MKTRTLGLSASLLAAAALLGPHRATAATGDPDSFAPHLNFDVHSVVVQPDGRVLLGGGFTAVTASLVARNAIARFHADGRLDTNFNPSAGGR